ncbi:hypothetical protein E2P81_ATG00289 [Venturia nashicola]|nr:hypothetical protein E2P81_ATG00289 [Venturia nashicola]
MKLPVATALFFATGAFAVGSPVAPPASSPSPPNPGRLWTQCQLWTGTSASPNADDTFGKCNTLTAHGLIDNKGPSLYCRRGKPCTHSNNGCTLYTLYDYQKKTWYADCSA